MAGQDAPFTAARGSPLPSPAADQLSPLSCLACRKQKKRCNRTYPACVACQQRNIDCSYTKRRIPSREQRLQAKLNRIAQLEATIKYLRRRCHSTTYVGNFASSSDTHFDSLQSSYDSSPPSEPTSNPKQEFGRLVAAQGASRYIASQFSVDIDHVCCCYPESLL